MENEPTKKVKQSSSPRYPGLALATSIQRAKELWDKEGKHPVPFAVLGKCWNYSEKSSSLRMVVAALGYYGLLTQAGGSGSGEFQLTERAMHILVGTNEEKRFAIEKAALEPKIYRQIWDKFGGDLPSDDNLTSRLLIDWNFHRDSVSGFLKDFRETLTLAGLDKRRNTDGGNGGESDFDFDGYAGERGKAESEPVKSGSAPENKNAVAPAGGAIANNTSTGKMIGTYSTLLGESDVTLTFTGRQLVPDDLDGLIEYAELLKKGLERRLRAEERQHQFPVNAIWRNEDTDMPVVIVGVMGRDDASGEVYFRSQTGTGIPRSELEFV